MKFFRLLLLSLLGMLLLAQQVFTIEGGMLSQVMHDAAHIPWFGTVSFLLATLLHGRTNWITLLVGVTVLAAATEFAQTAIAGRHASVSDLASNLVGATIGVGAWWCVARQNYVGLALVVLLGTCMTLFKPAQVWWSMQSAHDDFPLILNLDNPTTHRLVSATVPFEFSDKALHVFPSGVDEWPRVRIYEPRGDWSGYTTLVVEMNLEAEQPVLMWVSARYPESSGTSAYVSTRAHPGSNRLTFSTASLAKDKTSTWQRVKELAVYTKGHGENTGERWDITAIYLED